MQVSRNPREFPDYFFNDLAEMQNYVYRTLFLPNIDEVEHRKQQTKVKVYEPDKPR